MHRALSSNDTGDAVRAVWIVGLDSRLRDRRAWATGALQADVHRHAPARDEEGHGLRPQSACGQEGAGELEARRGGQLEREYDATGAFALLSLQCGTNTLRVQSITPCCDRPNRIGRCRKAHHISRILVK
jgi:hypothetical protein